MGGRNPGERNYAKKEIYVLLTTIEKSLPLGGDYWAAVREQYGEGAEANGFAIREAYKSNLNLIGSLIRTKKLEIQPPGPPYAVSSAAIVDRSQVAHLGVEQQNHNDNSTMDLTVDEPANFGTSISNVDEDRTDNSLLSQRRSGSDSRKRRSKKLSYDDRLI